MKDCIIEFTAKTRITVSEEDLIGKTVCREVIATIALEKLQNTNPILNWEFEQVFESLVK